MFFGLLVCLSLCWSLTVKNLPCERYAYDSRRLKTCYMNDTTTINSTGYSISSDLDTDVEVLTFDNNNKIHFLPENLAEKFANLLIYRARYCSIKLIMKSNFKGLTKLKELRLDYNSIELIPNNTFEDLISLDTLSLRELISLNNNL